DSDPRVKFPKSGPKTARDLFHKLRIKKCPECANEPPGPKRVPGHRPPRVVDDDDDVVSEPEVDDTPQPEGVQPPPLPRVPPIETSTRSMRSDPPLRPPPVEEHFPQRGDSEGSIVPVARWAAVGVGGAGLILGTTLGVLAAKNGSEALSEDV